MEKDSGCGLLMKLVGNGIVALLGGGGAILGAMSSLGGIVPGNLLVFGAYDLLYGVCLMLDEAAQRRKSRKVLNEAKQIVETRRAEFCKLVEENIQYMHRYIRFHVLWHKTVYKSDSGLPGGIVALQKSFDHLLAMYNRYC